MARPPLPLGTWGKTSARAMHCDDEGRPDKFEAKRRSHRLLSTSSDYVVEDKEHLQPGRLARWPPLLAATAAGLVRAHPRGGCGVATSPACLGWPPTTHQIALRQRRGFHRELHHARSLP
jgi:hypothetical protein